MDAGFDDVAVERLRRRRTVKWTFDAPDVLAAWVAEMDFDVAPAVRAAIVDADAGSGTASCVLCRPLPL
jgi:cystathionine beta-lyase